MNIFSTASSDQSQHQLQSQRISTRVFLLIFIFSSYILLIYTAKQTSTHSFTITAPTLEKYNQLNQRYSQTLTCPCSQISNKYGSFITIHYSRHPLCSSIFVTDRWITYVGLYRGILWINDFRYLARQMFQALQTLCQLTEESIKISLEQFYSRYHVTDLAINEELLRSQADATIEQFIASTTNQFRLSLRTIGNTTQANALLSGLFTNGYLYRGTDLGIHTGWNSYDACSCGIFSDCIAQVAMYANGSFSSAWTMPGFYRGCLILEIVRRSDLRCFFNQTCLDDFQAHLEIDQPLILTQLDPSSLLQFDADTTLGVIFDAMMVDQWNRDIDHASYFDLCHPKECLYTVVSRNGWVIIVTSLLGLVGGLATALKLIVPRVVWLIRWSSNREIRTHQSEWIR